MIEDLLELVFTSAEPPEIKSDGSDMHYDY